MTEPAVQRPALLLLSTGGTIAGSGATSTQVNTYAAAALSGDALLAAVPELQQLATIRVESIASVDSADLQFAHWRLLVAWIREAFLTQPDLAGVVITHGTNTLEETAWLLQLLIDDPRPVVLVGAMRPATALSADGPLNLYQAVEVAIDPQARGRGVLAVLDGEIHGARAVTKVATQGVGAAGALRVSHAFIIVAAGGDPAWLRGASSGADPCATPGRCAGIGLHRHRCRPAVGGGTHRPRPVEWPFALDAPRQSLWFRAGASLRQPCPFRAVAGGDTQPSEGPCPAAVGADRRLQPRGSGG